MLEKNFTHLNNSIKWLPLDNDEMYSRDFIRGISSHELDIFIFLIEW